MDEIVKRILENGREGCAHEWIVCGDGPCSECPYYNVVCTSMDIEQVFCKKCGKGKGNDGMAESRNDGKGGKDEQ